MIEFNDDLAAISINHLTGRALFDFKSEKGVVRRFDPSVQCLGDSLNANQLKFHATDNQ